MAEKAATMAMLPLYSSSNNNTHGILIVLSSMVQSHM